MERTSPGDTNQPLSGNIDDQMKTRDELLIELDQLRRVVAGLGAIGSGHKLEVGTENKYLHLLSIAAEQSTEGIAVIDLEGNLLALNNAFANIHGYSRDELIGKHLSIFHTPEQMPSVEAANQQLQATAEFKGEIWHVRRDGTVFPALMHNSLLRDDEGNQIGMIDTLRGITKHKQAEEGLIKRNKELTALNTIAQTVSQSTSLDEILNNALDKMLEILNIKNGSIAFFDRESRSFEVKVTRGTESHEIDIFTPVKLEEIGGTKIAQLRKPKFINSIPDSIELMPQNFVNLVRQQRLKSAMYVPLMAKGKVLGEICVFTRGKRIFTLEERELLITISHQISAGIENAQLREEASRASALEELDKLRTALLASVSHELRTPLTSIKGLASTLIQPDIEWDKETQQDFLETINRETDVLAHIVSDLMDMSQLEAGTIRMRKTKSTIASIIDQVSEQLRNTVGNHRFEVKLPVDAPPIYVDEVRIGEVITNLVSNATAYSEPDTRITLETSYLDGKVVTSISDEGIGIPSEHLNKIFDRFFRLESGVFRRRGGTGLGLSICKGIVENHDGQIWVESTPNRGSKFSFILPIAHDSEPAIAEAATAT
jgi:PAS domain S-box-containing protein